MRFNVSFSFLLKASLRQMSSSCLGFEITLSFPCFTFIIFLSPLASFSVSSGWGEMPNIHSKAENSWGEPASPSTLVDNGTAAWGKPPSSGSGWGDQPPEPAVTFGRAGVPATAPALCKPGTERSLCRCLVGRVRNGSEGWI